jgi:hypothetical protein
MFLPSFCGGNQYTLNEKKRKKRMKKEEKQWTSSPEWRERS